MKQLPYHEVAVGYDAVSGGVGRAGTQEGGAGPVVVPGVVLQRRPPALLETGQPGPGQPELPIVTNLEERVTIREKDDDRQR